MEDKKGKFVDLSIKESSVPAGVNGRSRSNSIYKSLLGRVEYFTEDELHSMIERMKTCDEKEKKDIKEKILMSYQPLVFRLATKYSTDGSQMDYVSEANMKFLEALESYDIDKGTTLTTYMINCIVNHFINIYGSNNGQICIPQHMRNSTKLSHKIAVFRNENEREPTEEEISDMCEEMGFPTKYVVNTCYGYKYFNIDDFGLHDEDASPVVNANWEELSDVMNEPFEGCSIINILDRYFNSYLKGIKCKSKRNTLIRNMEMLKKYYGIGCYNKSLSELKNEYGISKTECARIINRMLKLLSKIVPKKLVA